MLPRQGSGAAAPRTVVLCCLVRFAARRVLPKSAGPAASLYHLRCRAAADCVSSCLQIYTAEEKQALALVNFAAQKEKEAKVLSDLKVGICPFAGADVAPRC